MTRKDLKSAIAVLAAKQRATKEQRKTVRFIGTRTMSPNDAAAQARDNKVELKHMYLAYGVLRGREINQIVSEKTEYSERKLNELLTKYGEALCVSEIGS